MTEGLPVPPMHRSVFARLVAIMLTTAASLLGMVGIFFWLVVSSNAVSGRDVSTIHAALLTLVLISVAGAVFTAHLLVRRLLRPLQSLGDGVARLSAGQLDVMLPNPTADEFGTLTQAFNEMVGRIRGMLRAREQLLLDVSHELRSPLTRMKVALELVPAGPHREGMAADVAEMEAMIGELLERERLRDGRGLRLEPTALAPLLETAASGLRGRPPGVTIVRPPDDVQAAIDRERMLTVFRNLIENASKYSLPDSAPVMVRVEPRDDAIVVSVSDDGPGIPEADLGNVFEPFFRVDRSRSRKTGGYGLGLSICRRIVEAHHGEIGVENLTPRGARFTVTVKRVG
jgi:signal transduction histidine kinase